MKLILTFKSILEFQKIIANLQTDLKRQNRFWALPFDGKVAKLNDIAVITDARIRSIMVTLRA